MSSRLAPAAEPPPTARPAAPDARSTESPSAQGTPELAAVALALAEPFVRLDRDGRVLEPCVGT